MFRPFAFPLVLSVFVFVAGVIIAVQPIVDPGYVHPLALVLTGLGAAVMGAAGVVAFVALAAWERRDFERAQAHDAGADIAERCSDDCDWMCAHISEWVNTAR